MLDIDISDLQQEVIEHWNQQGVEYFFVDIVTNEPHQISESFIKDRYNEVLADPMQCIFELGYNSISEYIADRQPKKKGIFSYSGYIKYLKVNNINASPWVKQWAKDVLQG
jgi:hypothetical protein